MGAKAGAVPDMEVRIQRFVNKGYDSRHFADQDSLLKICGAIFAKMYLRMIEYLISVMQNLSLRVLS